MRSVNSEPSAAAEEPTPSRGGINGQLFSLPVLLVLAVAFSGLIVALAAFVAAREPGDSSAEAGFARDMSVHHAQGVEMAEIVRGKTGSNEIRGLAADMALTQQAEIGQMQGWLAVWGLPPTGPEPAMSWMGHPTRGPMPGMATPEEIERLKEASPDEADELFLRLMIPHHRSAVPMAEAVLEETDNLPVETLASSIATHQKGEIEVMSDMLGERGGEPAGHSHSSHSHADGHQH